MTLESDFIAKLSYPSPTQMLERLDELRSRKSNNGSFWSIKNEIKPSDLFCYLFARFGPPNGINNMFRSEDSDNLIHWHWTLKTMDGHVEIMGLNYRTDIFFTDFVTKVFHKNDFCKHIKMDFKQYGKEMSGIRQQLEPWVEFINPYKRLRKAVEKLVDELRDLKIEEISKVEYSATNNSFDAQETFRKGWKEAGGRLSKAFGLCFGIRSMLPVMAEAFINVLLFVMMRPEIKSDTRLRDSTFKQHIDVRIRRLHLDCVGFAQPVDYSSEICAKYHSLVNERNDLLHGNVVIDKLKFNDVYFAGTVPIFQEYRSMWHRAFDVQRQAVGLDNVMQELQTVNDMIEYVISCLDESAQEAFRIIIDKSELGLNTDNERIGVLFADLLIDMFQGPLQRVT